MHGVERALMDIEGLLRSVKIGEAEEKVKSLLYTIGDQELSVWAVDLRRAIESFLPKRRKALLLLLDSRLQEGKQEVVDENLDSPAEDIDLESLKQEFRNELQQLSQFHIFQWSTFYRDALSRIFDRFLRVLSQAPEPSAVLTDAAIEIEAHARDIFSKGYQYVTSLPGATPHYAISKSLAGLQKFLDLPIEFYSAKLSSRTNQRNSRHLRYLCSSWLAGIVKGYGSVQLDQAGWQVLPRFPRSWAHYLGFLTREDLASVVSGLEPGAFREGVEHSVQPLVAALDALALKSSLLSALGQLVWDQRRLDIAIRPPVELDDPHLLHIHCYFDPAFVSEASLREAASRDVSLIVAPLKPDIQEVILKDPILSRIVVPISEGRKDASAEATQRVVDVLEYAVYMRRNRQAAAAPLAYNFAREFPLHNPFLTKYYHVYRSSVLELLRTFERRNGVRLWCSVRRSGKTTACFDLGTTTGASVVVSQTCASTEQSPNATFFYDSVVTTLRDGCPISKSFLMDVVAKCATSGKVPDGRFVLVLDEYETLFGHLRAAARRDPELRYTVVQPLLNQMVAFARDNLLVFMGQEPNAHFILMDQNQLSAYVEQDSFPLFRHSPGSVSGEFSELLGKVLTQRIFFDAGFAGAVFAETSGHPFLTVKLIVSFVDWLIDQRRHMKDLILTEADIFSFIEKKLARRDVSTSSEYDFFRGAIADALSSEGKARNPWLYSIYSVLRCIGENSWASLSVSLSEYQALVEELGLNELGFTADELLRTGRQANFFGDSPEIVRPKIPLLGRIAGVTHPKITA